MQSDSPTWLDLWRWYVVACVWICSCGCTDPDCCNCCIWDPAVTQDEQRERIILERVAQLENKI